MGIRGLHHPLYCIQCSQSDSLYAQQSRAMTFPMAEESQLHATHLSPTALKARISKCVAFELLQVGSNKIAGSIFWVIFFRAPFWCFFWLISHGHIVPKFGTPLGSGVKPKGDASGVLWGTCPAAAWPLPGCIHSSSESKPSSAKSWMLTLMRLAFLMYSHHGKPKGQATKDGWVPWYWRVRCCSLVSLLAKVLQRLKVSKILNSWGQPRLDMAQTACATGREHPENEKREGPTPERR